MEFEETPLELENQVSRAIKTAPIKDVDEEPVMTVSPLPVSTALYTAQVSVCSCW